jgi:hypothetical protein
MGLATGDGINETAAVSFVGVSLLATGGAPCTLTATDTVRIANTELKCVFIYFHSFNFRFSASSARGGLY